MRNHNQNKEEINSIIKPIALRFGIVSGFICVIASLVLFFTNLEYNTLFSALPFILLILIIIVSQQQIIKANNRLSFNYNSTFKIGFTITIITALLLLLYTLFYCFVLEPDFINKMNEVTRSKLIEKNLSEEKIEQALEMSSKFTSPISASIIKSVITIILGSITSAVGAAIFKNEK